MTHSYHVYCILQLFDILQPIITFDCYNLIIMPRNRQRRPRTDNHQRTTTRNTQQAFRATRSMSANHLLSLDLYKF